MKKCKDNITPDMSPTALITEACLMECAAVEGEDSLAGTKK